jgi:hypothetical protein|tara:strand:+ start:1998 stop:2144 length:147 start_codon:yes stop_codon:yes gene_type:complete
MVFFDDILTEFRKMDGKKIDITQDIDMDKLKKELDRKQFESIRRRITF